MTAPAAPADPNLGLSCGPISRPIAGPQGENIEKVAGTSYAVHTSGPSVPPVT